MCWICWCCVCQCRLVPTEDRNRTVRQQFTVLCTPLRGAARVAQAGTGCSLYVSVATESSRGQRRPPSKPAAEEIFDSRAEFCRGESFENPGAFLGRSSGFFGRVSNRPFLGSPVAAVPSLRCFRSLLLRHSPHSSFRLAPLCAHSLRARE